jgi:hypothetical protein
VGSLVEVRWPRYVAISPVGKICSDDPDVEAKKKKKKGKSKLWQRGGTSIN